MYVRGRSNGKVGGAGAQDLTAPPPLPSFEAPELFSAAPAFNTFTSGFRQTLFDTGDLLEAQLPYIRGYGLG